MKIKALAFFTILILPNPSYGISLVFIGPECDTGNIIESRMEIVGQQDSVYDLKITGSIPRFVKEGEFGCLAKSQLGLTKPDTRGPPVPNTSIEAMGNFFGNILTVSFSQWISILFQDNTNSSLSYVTHQAITFTMQYTGNNQLRLLYQIGSSGSSLHGSVPLSASTVLNQLGIYDDKPVMSIPDIPVIYSITDN